MTKLVVHSQRSGIHGDRERLIRHALSQGFPITEKRKTNRIDSINSYVCELRSHESYLVVIPHLSQSQACAVNNFYLRGFRNNRFGMGQPPVYYFDNNATTRVAPEVLEAMLPFLTDYWGNPSSAYSFGRQLVKHVEEARAKVAALIKADPREIVFTSCGTESNNSAIHSALATHPEKRHVLTTAVEHSSNLKFL